MSLLNNIAILTIYIMKTIQERNGQSISLQTDTYEFESIWRWTIRNDPSVFLDESMVAAYYPVVQRTLTYTPSGCAYINCE